MLWYKARDTCGRLHEYFFDEKDNLRTAAQDNDHVPCRQEMAAYSFLCTLTTQQLLRPTFHSIKRL